MILYYNWPCRPKIISTFWRQSNCGLICDKCRLDQETHTRIGGAELLGNYPSILGTRQSPGPCQNYDGNGFSGRWDLNLTGKQGGCSGDTGGADLSNALLSAIYGHAEFL